MNEVKSIERRYFIGLEELAKKFGLVGEVSFVHWNDLEPGTNTRVEVKTTELVKNDLVDGDQE